MEGGARVTKRAAVGYVRGAERVAVGYVRVSTKKQLESGIDKSGLSTENQVQKLAGWASLKDTPLAKVYEDGAESAKDLNRPEIQEIIARIKRGEVSHLVMYKLDRLTRSLRDLDYLMHLCIETETTLVSVTENLDTSTATGRLMVNLIGLFAQWEREQIAERTQVALDLKRQRGEKLGGIVPYGWRARQGRLLPHEDEQKVLRAILRERGKGRGFLDIAEALNEQGVRPRKGRRWYASTIRAICLRAAREPSSEPGPTGKGGKEGTRDT